MSGEPPVDVAALVASLAAAADADLADYYATTRGAKGQLDSDGYETPNSGDDDAPGQTLAKWANSVSPLRGKAPLSLSHRNSVQRRRDSSAARMGPDAAVAGGALSVDASAKALLGLAVPDAALGSRCSFDGGRLLPPEETKLPLGGPLGDNGSGGDTCDVQQSLWLICFDLLAALRGAPCSYFQEVQAAPNVPSTWSWADGVATGRLPVPPSTFLCVHRVLAAADYASQLRSLLLEVVRQLGEVTNEASSSSSSSPPCLAACGAAVLRAFLQASRLVLDGLEGVLLHLQEVWPFEAADPTVGLLRCAAAVDESCGFLLHVAKSASLTRVDVPPAARAARLVDVLTVHAARSQASGNTTLFGQDMALLLLCVWPYCAMFVPTIHGDNQPLDRQAWLQATPKLFRTSFKVRRAEAASDDEPAADDDDTDGDDAWTDALALVVSCEGIADKTDRRGHHGGIRADVSHLLSAPAAVTTSRRGGGGCGGGGGGAPSGAPSGDLRVVLDQRLALQLFCVNTPLERGYRLERLQPYAVLAAEWGAFEGGRGNAEAEAEGEEEQQQQTAGSFGEGWRAVTVPATVPLSHWLTVHILQPIAHVVRVFHQAHLRGLLQPPTASAPWSALSLAGAGGDTSSIAGGGGREEGEGPVSFASALDLLRDVVLCAAWGHVIDSFLDRATAQGHWWYRSSRAVPPTGGPATYTNCNTASKHLSAHFLDAVRMLPLGRCVTLVVLPNSHTPTQRGGDSAAAEIIATFDAMRLVFSFPESIGIVLAPQQFYGDVAENFQSGDPYSRMFSFLCAFAYAKKVLLTRWKEQHHKELRSYTGIVKASSASRGDATNNHQLGFLCNTLLVFAQQEALSVAAQLRARVETGDPRSVSAVCQFVDAFQTQLGVLCATPLSVMRDAVFLALKQLYAQLLRVALDNNATSAWTAEQIRLVAGGLVATLESLPEGSGAGARLRPVLLQLTFNRFY